MPIQFHKMHGAGNDFVLLDHRQSDAGIDASLAERLADRRHGVGCDQVLVLRPDETESCAARYEVFNADGSVAGQCGNGVRCIALYLHRRGEFSQPAADNEDGSDGVLRLQGPAGAVQIHVCPDGEFECAMGEPSFAPRDIPLEQSLLADSGGDEWTLEVAGQSIRLGAVSMGNPHAVVVVEDVDMAPLATLGPAISRHPAFPDSCNVGFAQVVDRDNIRLRVFERGTGETLACGSGACAAVAVLAARGSVSSAVKVLLPGGLLVIKWAGPGNEMTMKGPAAHVFRGTLDE